MQKQDTPCVTHDKSPELTTTIGSRQTEYLHHATAFNTRRAYQSAIRQFEKHGGLLPATVTHIAEYITQRATKLNPRTLSLHITALSHWHRYQNLSDPTQAPTIRKLLIGVYRQHGQPKRKAKALHPHHIKKMMAQCQKSTALKSHRDQALVLIAYFGALRRSELVAITVDHLQFDDKGLLLLIPKSKTDPTRIGKTRALPYGNGAICPVTALQQWLTIAGINSGFVFRGINRWNQLQTKGLHPDSVSLIIKSLARACQFDFVDQLSSHSMRRGFATSAAGIGADFESIKKQGGWKNDQTVRDYIEEGQLFDSNAANQLLQAAFEAPHCSNNPLK